eukprot:2563081-Rhodomonas_salina.2
MLETGSTARFAEERVRPWKTRPARVGTGARSRDEGVVEAALHGCSRCAAERHAAVGVQRISPALRVGARAIALRSAEQ